MVSYRVTRFQGNGGHMLHDVTWFSLYSMSIEWGIKLPYKRCMIQNNAAHTCEYVVMMQLLELKQHGPSHKRIVNKTLKSILVTSKFKSQCLYRCLFCILFFQWIPAKTPSAPKLILQQGHAGCVSCKWVTVRTPTILASLIAIWSAAA